MTPKRNIQLLSDAIWDLRNEARRGPSFTIHSVQELVRIADALIEEILANPVLKEALTSEAK